MVELKKMNPQSKLSAAAMIIGLCLGAASLTGCTK
jgi:spore maturation protein SpmA